MCYSNASGSRSDAAGVPDTEAAEANAAKMLRGPRMRVLYCLSSLWFRAVVELDQAFGIILTLNIAAASGQVETG